MKKILLIAAVLLLSSCCFCGDEGNEELTEFVNSYTDSNPTWWEDGGKEFQKVFAEKMTSDIAFAKIISQNVHETYTSQPLFFLKERRVINVYENINHKNELVEYGERVAFDLVSAVKVKNPLPDGSNYVYLGYTIISDIPSTIKGDKRDRPYVDLADTCAEHKEENSKSTERIDFNGHTVYFMGTYHLSYIGVYYKCHRNAVCSDTTSTKADTIPTKTDTIPTKADTVPTKPNDTKRIIDTKDISESKSKGVVIVEHNGKFDTIDFKNKK